ncbi:hypothetical protein AURDEDRAFT_163642 [Auricularia subglabra TFB-10046 SS5]|nr:hypothetical protein AURDEDRAFT_163642 [Auricularia subglabra TFB-10046 SS5]
MTMTLGVYSELQPGNEILAQPLTGVAPSLTIRVSSHVIARGGMAVILKGDVVPSGFAVERMVVALKVLTDTSTDGSNNYHEVPNST